MKGLSESVRVVLSIMGLRGMPKWQVASGGVRVGGVSAIDLRALTQSPAHTGRAPKELTRSRLHVLESMSSYDMPCLGLVWSRQVLFFGIA